MSKESSDKRIKQSEKIDDEPKPRFSIIKRQSIWQHVPKPSFSNRGISNWKKIS